MEGFSEALLFILGFSECRVIPADLGPMVVPTVDNPKVRELGVTLHLLLHSTGDTIPDAPAVYFCLSSDENIQRICQDLSSYYYNFISPVSRTKLEDLATAALQAGSKNLVQRLPSTPTLFAWRVRCSA